jgi:protein disulfide-isomerase A6
MILLFLLFTKLLSASFVVKADEYSFKSIVMDSPHVVMVEFFAPWCGHCQRLAPEYESAAKRLSGLAKLVAVDCDSDLNKPLCGKFGVRGFPTLKIFGGGTPKGHPSGFPHNNLDYQGERTADAIVREVRSRLPATFVKDIGGTTKKSVALQDFISKDYVNV